MGQRVRATEQVLFLRDPCSVFLQSSKQRTPNGHRDAVVGFRTTHRWKVSLVHL